MCPLQRPKKTTRSNSTPQKSSGTFAPKVIPSVQRQSAQRKTLPPFQPSSNYNYTSLHEMYGHPKPAAIQPYSLEQPGSYQGWDILQRSSDSPPTSTFTPETLQGKVSQQKSIAQLRHSLRPKRWERKPVHPRGQNNVMQLKAAAKLPLDSLQPMRRGEVLQRVNETSPTQDNENSSNTAPQTITKNEKDNSTTTNNAPETLPFASHQEERVVSSAVATDLGGWLAPPEIKGQFPENPPEYREQGNVLVDSLKNVIEQDPGTEYYKIEIANNSLIVVCRDMFSQGIQQTLYSSSMIDGVDIDDEEGNVPTQNGSYIADEDYVTIRASINLSQFQLDPVSRGQVKIFGDFNGTPNPPLAEKMHEELIYHVNQSLKNRTYHSISVEVHKGTKNVKLSFKGKEKFVETVIRDLRSKVVNNLNVTYRSIFKQGKRFFKSKKQKKFSFSRSRNKSKDQESVYTVTMGFLRPTDWPDIMSQAKNAAVSLGQADAFDIAQEQAFNNDNAYTILDRFKMILQIMKGEGEDVPDKVSDLIGNSSSLWAWSVPGLNLLAILNKFLNIGKYSKRRKQLRKALTKTQEELSDENVNQDKQDRLQKLLEGIKYGIQKMKKLIVTLWIDAIASIVQLLSRIFTLIFPQIAVGTVFVDVAATATKLGSLLFRKGKGLYKHIKGTRGRKRYESAESIFSSALSGDEAGLMAIRALNVKTLIGKIGGGLWTATKKSGKGIGTTIGAGWSRAFGTGKVKPTVKLNKGGLDTGLSDKGKKQMQWGKWPSDQGDFKKMLENVNSNPRPKLVFIKALSNELKSSL